MAIPLHRFSPQIGAESDSKQSSLTCLQQYRRSTREREFLFPLILKHSTRNKAGIIRDRTLNSGLVLRFHYILEIEKNDNTTTKSLILAQDER